MKKTNKSMVKMAKPTRTTKKTTKRLTKSVPVAKKAIAKKSTNKNIVAKKVTVKKVASKKPVVQESQYNVILNHLIKNGSIHTVDAIKKYGVLRLGAIIHNLREGGIKIVTSTHTLRNKSGRNSNVAKYVYNG
jgi:hypothetical protein